MGSPCLTIPGIGFRWYKDGTLLTSGGKYQILSEPRSGLLVLEIQAADKEDLGLYECEVRWLGQQEGVQGICFGDPAWSPPSVTHDERGGTRPLSSIVSDERTGT